jgi:murein DD-endopeptidase MepM/ murein hydrolase activator NlpD
MTGPTRFNVLVIRGGTRVSRVTFGARALAAAVVLFGLLSFALGALSGERIAGRYERYRVAALAGIVHEQQQFIDSFHQRVATIRNEIASWRQLHHDMWEPFGPKGKGPRTIVGIGGPPGIEPAAIGRLPLAQEIDLLASTVEQEGKSLRALARLVVRIGRVFASLPSRWPVRGAINSEFGPRLSPWSGARELHSGLDIDADRGTPVKAPAPGTVLFAGRAPAYGLSVLLDHGNYITTRYGHLDKIQVARGQRLERGQVLGLSGNTGRSTGPHLHYEILVKGQPVNPKTFLWE